MENFLCCFYFAGFFWWVKRSHTVKISVSANCFALACSCGLLCFEFFVSSTPPSHFFVRTISFFFLLLDSRYFGYYKSYKCEYECVSVSVCLCVMSQKAKERKNLTLRWYDVQTNQLYFTQCVCVSETDKKAKNWDSIARSNTQNTQAVTSSSSTTYMQTYAYIRTNARTHDKNIRTHSQTHCIWQLASVCKKHWIQVKAIYNQDTTRGHCRCHFHIRLIWKSNSIRKY